MLSARNQANDNKYCLNLLNELMQMDKFIKKKIQRLLGLDVRDKSKILPMTTNTTRPNQWIKCYILHMF